MRRHLSQDTLIIVAAIVVGVLCGIAAWLLKFCIKYVGIGVSHLCKNDGYNWPFLVFPFIGIMLTGIVCRYFLKYSPANGTAKLISDLKNGVLSLKPSLMYSSILTSSITLGFGGSAGGEGPIAYTGAAIGSNIGRKFGLSADLMRTMIGFGAAAGIAGIFKSPIGGAFYAIEVLKMNIAATSLIGLFVAAIIASLIAYSLSGFTYDIAMDQSLLFSPDWIPWIITLGIFCGFYSLYYKYVMNVLARMFNNMSNQWRRNLIGGGMLAVTVSLCPSLYGEGYGAIGPVINGEYYDILKQSIWEGYLGIDALIWVALLTIALKTFACAATTYGGGVAGQFAPTLFAGCISGMFFALASNSLFDTEIQVSHAAFFGMAGVMAGVIRAPLIAIFLTCEMSGSFGYFLPVALCASVSLGVVRLFTANKFFHSGIDKFDGAISRIFHTNLSQSIK